MSEQQQSAGARFDREYADAQVDAHGAAALLLGDDSAGPVIAELIGGAFQSHEFLDRWRSVGSSSANW